MADLTAKGRRAEASMHVAEPDGSFPIKNLTDLRNAINDWGRAGSKASDKRWIIHRATVLGLEKSLPANWR
jgi:hypothetical protein